MPAADAEDEVGSVQASGSGPCLARRQLNKIVHHDIIPSFSCFWETSTLSTCRAIFCKALSCRCWPHGIPTDGFSRSGSVAMIVMINHGYRFVSIQKFT